MEKKWIKPGADGKADKFFCVATFLPVKRWWSIPAFLKMSLRVEAQLKHTPGLLRYGLKTDLPR
ncbi:MAG: hypothetical protein KGM47_17530, partial [Acidobacteriota bacterium]|nr:hypothetical protein [Acidobacteriota bacterium]